MRTAALLAACLLMLNCPGIVVSAAPPSAVQEDLLAPAQRLADAARVLSLPSDVLPHSAQGVEYVLGALNTGAGASDAGVAQAALSALARITDEQPPGADGSSPALVIAALEGGAMGAVAAALRQHGNHRGVAGAACAAVYALGRHTAAYESAGTAGVMELVHGALVQHASDGEVVAMCSHALMHLGIDAGHKARFGELAGAPATLLGALRTHSDNMRVARCVCGALNNCAAGHSGNKAAVVAAGGLEAVTQTLLAHRRDANVAEQACGALAVLAMTEGASQRAMKAGSIESVVAVLEAHSGQRRPKQSTGRAPLAPSARVVASCARAVASIAWADADAQRLARDVLAPEALRAAQSAFSEDPHVQKWTAKALEKVSDPVIESFFEGMMSNDMQTKAKRGEL